MSVEMDPITSQQTYSQFAETFVRWHKEGKKLPVRYKPTWDEPDFCQAMVNWLSKQWFGKPESKLACCICCEMKDHHSRQLLSFCGPNGYAIFRAWCVRNKVELK